MLIIFIGPASAGQVITKEVREWAKEAIAKEKTLETAFAKKTLAILYFKNKTGQSRLDPLQKGLTLMLITDLSTLKGLQVVERVKLQAVTEELGFGVSGLVDAKTAPRVGKLLGVQWLVGGDILEKGNAPLHVESDLLDVPSPKVLGQPTADGMLDEFFKIEKELLFKIIALLKIELTSEERARLEKPFSTNIKAILDMSRAIQASDQGNYDKAEKYYERALKRDSGIAPARVYLDELRSLSKIGPVSSEQTQLLESIRDETSLTDQKTTEETTKEEENPSENQIPITIEVPVPGI